MNTTASFEAMALAQPLQRALHELQYHKASPIQAEAIPPQLQGNDIIGCAQTGTGKTAAFALPILHHLATNPKTLQPKGTRTLVLTPTRELAVQVGESFVKYGRYLRFRHVLVYGGVSQNPQAKALQRGVDVLVATPGRLLDLLNQRIVRLDQVDFLVLDEVDRMLDMGFITDVRKIAAYLPKERQTALFTATLTKEVESIASEFIRGTPVRIKLAPDQPAAERVHQVLCHVTQDNKFSLLEHYLNVEGEQIPRTLVFSRTRHGAERLSRRLNQRGIPSESIHGDKSQSARQKALDGFRAGRTPVLVATDVAARGIDVKAVALVVNFDFPDAPDTYVHRIGRTARAEAHGRAITFCEDKNWRDLRGIQKFLGREIEVDANHPYHAAPRDSKSSEPRSRHAPRKPNPSSSDRQNQKPDSEKRHGKFRKFRNQKSFGVRSNGSANPRNRSRGRTSNTAKSHS